MPQQDFLTTRTCVNVLKKTPENTDPITPVDITRVLLDRSEVWGNCSSTAVAIWAASSRPPLPVTALAQPELITMALIPSPKRFRRVSRLTVTGAAWNLFFVNTAAAEQGFSDEISARSGKCSLLGFTPT